MGSKVFIAVEYWKVVFLIRKIFNIHEDGAAMRVKSLQVLWWWGFRNRCGETFRDLSVGLRVVGLGKWVISIQKVPLCVHEREWDITAPVALRCDVTALCQRLPSRLIIWMAALTKMVDRRAQSLTNPPSGCCSPSSHLVDFTLYASSWLPWYHYYRPDVIVSVWRISLSVWSCSDKASSRLLLMTSGTLRDYGAVNHSDVRRVKLCWWNYYEHLCLSLKPCTRCWGETTWYPEARKYGSNLHWGMTVNPNFLQDQQL